MPRFRFKLKWMMVAVAIVGVVLGIALERHHRFGKIATHYRSEFEKFPFTTPYEHFMSWSERDNCRFVRLHEMNVKYERAARYPWLPVPPDPPEPK